MLGQYPWDDQDADDSDFETKGGKPNKGTPADARLKVNKGDDSMPPASPKKPKKPPFPGAAEPFKSKDSKEK